MKLSVLQKQLIAAARNIPPDEHVPHAFEKRITALLMARTTFDRWAFWSQALWRGAVSCVAVAMVVGAVSFLQPSDSRPSGDLAQEFENTMLASGYQDANTIW